MFTVGLTGNVGSGKSTVARLWEEVGVPVIYADALAREAVEPGSPGLRQVIEAFGDGVLAADGSLDRAGVRDVVFDDLIARRRLEAIVHPVVRSLRDRWLAERRTEGAPLVVSEIPLLFESGRTEDFDAIVFVDAPADVRRARIVEHRGIGPEVAERIMAAQMDADTKRARSDYVIDNTGTIEDLKAEAMRVLEDLGERAGPP